VARTIATPMLIVVVVVVVGGGGGIVVGQVWRALLHESTGFKLSHDFDIQLLDNG